MGTKPILSIAAAAALLVATAARVGADASDVARPTVTGPVTGGQGYPSLVTTNTDLAAVGYDRAEYFVDGTATSYEPDSALESDGAWTVKENDEAKYKTRIVVYKPTNPDDFSGTVFVEWFNVSAGFDTTPSWTPIHTQLIRHGDAYVGVDVQAAGVQGGAEVLEGATAGGIKGGDPARYGSLHHPGDEFAYDIFSQVGAVASGRADGVNPFDGYDVQHIIATGQSQSAYFLTSYINGIQPLVHQYDGFLVLSRGGSAAPFTDFTKRDFEAMPKDAHIRSDVDVPVLTAETETDLITLRFLPARQPDGKRFRLWEIAGGSHADQYTGTVGSTDVDDGAAELTMLDPAQADGGILSCTEPINANATFSVQSAAAAHLERWVTEGTPPPKAPRIATKGGTIERDEHGIARGGIRTPVVDVPVATNTGKVNRGGRFCNLFGTITVFDPPTLAQLYPSHDAYVQEFDRAAAETVKGGFWLAPDADDWKAAARQISVP